MQIKILIDYQFVLICQLIELSPFFLVDQSKFKAFCVGFWWKLKYENSLECFDRILRNPPNPLAYADIWFQIGHVYEQQRDVSWTI